MAPDREPICTTFTDLLESGRPLVADGAMGTTLFSLGLQGGGCPELLNIEQPDLVEKVHRGFIDAGADIILTNTFGGNRRRLALHHLEGRVAELNAAAVEIARRAADQAGRPVAVAGSVGPTGDIFEPLGQLSHAEGVEVFAEQCQALADAGADVIWIETISAYEELNAAVEGALTTKLPITTTLSFDTAGHTMMGISATDFGRWWLEHPQVTALGANCGIGPGDAVAASFDLTALAPAAVTITKANCGIPLYQTEGLTYPIGPDRMGDYVELALRSGTRIIGACCGSTPDHIAAIREAVNAYQPAPRPERDEIEHRLEAYHREPAGARRSNRRRS
ncbi:MAG TPA: betaine--homocysteine S-methyltransferase [Acidimicrobiia bacterium]|nr:betaine--homocysteine S-methyltransferase [Acidimicrobiia bacterium]